jgi:hypothetical protein
MESEQKQIKHNLFQLCWYMRGGLTYEEAFFLSSEERKIISSIVKQNLETTKKTGIPFF